MPALNVHVNGDAVGVDERAVAERVEHQLDALDRVDRGDAVEGDDELLAAPPPGERRLAERDDLGEAPQHVVAGAVAVHVVDPLEVVEVDERHRHRRAVRRGPPHHALEHPLAPSPGWPAR